MQFKNGVNYLTFTLKKKKISPAVSLLAAVALALFCGMVSSFLPEKTVNFLSEEMILGIVPDNFFTPFLEGNPLQIIFLAVLAGMAMLILVLKHFTVTDIIGSYRLTIGIVRRIDIVLQRLDRLLVLVDC